MSREIKEDFLLLKSFLDGYNLTHLLSDNNYINFISQQHKKYFSYLTFIAEIQNYTEDPDFNNIITSFQMPYLKESCSDTGISFFSTFHGNYKSSKLLLRSSIETFLKGFFLDEITNLDKETNMYDFFRRIKTLPFCSTQPTKTIIEKLHNSYKLLCKDVHTATDSNMASLSAMNYFPTFNKEKAAQVSRLSHTLITSYLILLCIKYTEQYHTFHFKNRKIIIKSIPRSYRKLIPT